MELLTVESFLPHITGLANKDTLSPGEASRLLLLITELLLDHFVDLQLLKFLSRFLTPQIYDEIIEERNIEHQCGYITCNKSPKQNVRRLSVISNGSASTLPAFASPGASATSMTKYQIYNRKPSMILPNTYLSQYCCKEHYQASLFYRNQLSLEAVFARKDIMVAPPFPAIRSWYENTITCLEEVLAKHRELKEQGKTLGEVITMMNGLSVSEDDKDTNELIKLIEDFEIVEKEGGVHGDDLDSEDETDTNAVEGYVTTNKSFGGYVV